MSKKKSEEVPTTITTDEVIAETATETVAEATDEVVAEVTEQADKMPVKARPPRTDILHIELGDLEMDDQNRTINLEKVHEYAKTIKEYGVKKSLRVKKNPVTGKYTVMDGFHRTLAAIECRDKLHSNPGRIPCELVKRGYNEEDRIIDMFIMNDGEPLNLIDAAKFMMRMIEKGYKQTEVAAKIGKHPSYVSYTLMLDTAPKAIKDFAIKGLIKPSLLLKLIQNHKDDIENGWKIIEKEIRIISAELKDGEHITEKKINAKSVKDETAPVITTKYHKMFSKCIESLKEEGAPKEVIQRATKMMDLLNYTHFRPRQVQEETLRTRHSLSSSKCVFPKIKHGKTHFCYDVPCSFPYISI